MFCGEDWLAVWSKLEGLVICCNGCLGATATFSPDTEEKTGIVKIRSVASKMMLSQLVSDANDAFSCIDSLQLMQTRAKREEMKKEYRFN